MKQLISHSFPRPKPRFDAAFIERRMEAHQRKMANEATKFVKEIFKVAAALNALNGRKPAAKRLAR